MPSRLCNLNRISCCCCFHLMCALLITVTHSVGGDNLLETFTHRPWNLTSVYFIGFWWWWETLRIWFAPLISYLFGRCIVELDSILPPSHLEHMWEQSEDFSSVVGKEWRTGGRCCVGNLFFPTKHFIVKFTEDGEIIGSFGVPDLQDFIIGVSHTTGTL